MIKRLLLAAVATVIGLTPVPVAAEETVEPSQPVVGRVIITALQTGQPSAAGNEFVELYNSSAQSVQVQGWKLQYRPAASTETAPWTTKLTIACDVPGDCAIASGERLLLATYEVIGSHTQLFAGGFSAAGGQVRVVHNSSNADTEVIDDLLGYGTALVAEGGQPAAAPPEGQSLIRATDTEGNIIDTGVNAQDFYVGCYEPPQPVPCPEPPAPAEDQDLPVPPVGNTDTSEPPLAGDGEVTGNPGSQTYVPLYISELLPDPASPQLDSTDEFIELFNPHATTVDLTGYRLEAGDDFRYHFTFGGGNIAPGGYVALMSAESRIPLTNSGTGVRLLDPNGDVVDEVADYGLAKAGQSWAKGPSDWQWTTTPTPGQANVIVATPPKVLAAASAAVKAASTKKPAAAKVTKAPAASKTTAKAKATTVPPQQAAATPPQGGGFAYTLLIPVGVLALGYVIYEYRKEIAGLWHKIRRMLTPQKQADKDVTLQTD